MAPMTVIETITITRPLKVSVRRGSGCFFSLLYSRKPDFVHVYKCRYPGDSLPVRGAGYGLAGYVPSVDRLAADPRLASRIVPPLHRRDYRNAFAFQPGREDWLLPSTRRMYSKLSVLSSFITVFSFFFLFFLSVFF